MKLNSRLGKIKIGSVMFAFKGYLKNFRFKFVYIPN